MVAALLTDRECLLRNVSGIRDVEIVGRMIRALGGDVEHTGSGEIRIHAADLTPLSRDSELTGLSHGEAIAAARRRLGNMTRIREESRDSWGFRTIESVLQDFRHALRALRRAPGFTITIVITLGLGLGASTAIFSVVNGVLLRPLPFPHEDRLITLCEQYPGASNDWCSVSPPNVEDIDR